MPSDRPLPFVRCSRGGLKAETQVIVTVLSADGENDTDVVAMLGASLALEISDIPFGGPLAGVRVGRIGDEWVMNPLQTEIARSDVNIFLSGTRDGILMVEGGAAIVPEDGVLDALFQGHQANSAAHRPAGEAQGPAWQDQACSAPGGKGRVADSPCSGAGRGEAQGGGGHRRQEANGTAGSTKSAARSWPRVRRSFPAARRKSGAPSGAREVSAPGPRAAAAQAHRRTRPQGCASHYLRRWPAAAHPRVGTLHAGRNAGHGGSHPGYGRRRSADRRAHRRAVQEVHASLQIPSLQHRRGQVSAQPGPAGDRPRRPGRAGDEVCSPRGG